jgi:hypothetical protein
MKKLLLFGGGNVETERGDPGARTYDPVANVWEELELDQQPTQRALSPLVYDPVNKTVVLFGGDRLDRLLSDTWTFDGQQWEEKTPAVAPAPRGGHALVWPVSPRCQDPDLEQAAAAGHAAAGLGR